ncbi:MAG: TetR/AcrR family transcriptional regulator [Spirochaetales bacterium]|nr:TetR/AcrR family transcriptional regulator [Spirochaetales bacterium]
MSSKKADWLEAGLEILSAEGPSALTIDNLVTVMGKTKGSFYHHFSNSKNFVNHLITYWFETYTVKILEKSKKGLSPNEKLKTLVQSTLKIPRKTELAIRAWALYDPDVRQYQEKIDTARLEYLYEIFFSVTNDKKSSRHKAFKIYSAFIGYQQLANYITGNKSPIITELFEIANYEIEN